MSDLLESWLGDVRFAGKLIGWCQICWKADWAMSDFLESWLGDVRFGQITKFSKSGRSLMLTKKQFISNSCWYSLKIYSFPLSKCDQIHSFLRIWPHLMKKSLMENFMPELCQSVAWIFYNLEFMSVYVKFV